MKLFFKSKLFLFRTGEKVFLNVIAGLTRNLIKTQRDCGSLCDKQTAAMTNLSSNNKLLVLIAIFLIGTKGICQDFHFSQFYVTSVLLNPAECGNFHEDYRVTAVYRDQWRSVSSPFSTQQGSFDMKFLRKKNMDSKLNLGMTFVNDRAGTANMGYYQMGGCASTTTRIGKKIMMGMGLKMTLNQNSFNPSQLSWDSQWDQSTGYSNGAANGEQGGFTTTHNFQDFGGGLTLGYKKDEYHRYDFGAAIDNVVFYNLSSTYGKDPLKMRFTYTGSATYKLHNKNYVIIPKALLLQQGPNIEIMPGCMIKYFLGMESHYTHANRASAISFGAFYRGIYDAIVINMLYDHKHYFSFGLSYDVNISRLIKASYGIGGFEITLLHTGMLGKRGKQEVATDAQFH